MFNIFSKKKEPIKLWFETDIHCHVIPGIDDGSPDLDTSVQLVERMASWGINRIIATPHVREEVFENSPDTIDPPLEMLRDALVKKGIKVDLSHTAEYRIDDLLLKHLAQGIITPYPNNYLLVENSFVQERIDMDEYLFGLQVKGYQPILAHPERYTYYYANPQRYKELHDRGILFQCNLLSLAGHYGEKERQWVDYLIKNDMIDFIGTDLHNNRHADSIDRYLASKQALKDKEKLQGVIKNDTAFN